MNLQVTRAFIGLSMSWLWLLLITGWFGLGPVGIVDAQPPLPAAPSRLPSASGGSLVPKAVAEPQVSPLAETRLNLLGLRLIAYAPDGKSVRAGSTKGRFQKMATSDLSLIGESEALPPYGVASASNTADKRWIAAGNWRGLAVVFDSKTTEVVGQCPDDPEKDPTPITAMKLSADGTLLVTGQRSSIVRLHNLKEQTLVWESKPLEQEIASVDLSVNGKFVAVSTGELKDFNEPGKLVVLDASNGQEIFTNMEMNSKVNHAIFTPDSKAVLAADNARLKMFDPHGRLLTEYPVHSIQRIRLLDNRRAILARYPGMLCLFDLMTAKIITTYKGHAKNPDANEAQLLWALDVAPDGKAFASADSHGNVGIWPIQ